MIPLRVLFVCMGNICRSPMAEAVLRHQVAARGLAHRIEVDSAGTGDWHVGDAPHANTQQQLSLHGIGVEGMQARQFEPGDLEAFDYVVAMDDQNLADMRAIAGDALDAHAQVSLLLTHAPELGEREVPDPYYVGGYDRVYDLVDPACAALLDTICEREGL